MCYLESSGEGGFQWSRTEGRTSLVAQTVKNLPAMQETQVQSLGQEDPLEKEWQPTPVFLPGKSHDRGAWWATVHERVTKNQT